MASGWRWRLIGAGLGSAQLQPQKTYKDRGFLGEAGVSQRSEKHGVTQEGAQTFRRLARRLQRSLGPSARLPVLKGLLRQVQNTKARP